LTLGLGSDPLTVWHADLSHFSRGNVSAIALQLALGANAEEAVLLLLAVAAQVAVLRSQGRFAGNFFLVQKAGPTIRLLYVILERNKTSSFDNKLINKQKYFDRF
jgi:hypothetical protein